MSVDLTAEEAELLKTLLLAEIEVKRVEMHHARNMDYKSVLQHQEKLLHGILKHFK